MKRNILLTISILLMIVPAYAQNSASAVKPEDQIMAVVNELRDAAKRNDRAVYERIIADNYFFIHSNGATSNRKMYLDNWVSGAQSMQQTGAGMKMTDEQGIMHGPDAAVHVIRGVLTNPAQNTELHLRTVSVFSKVNGRWQKIFGETSPLPARPKAASIDFKLLDAYVGEYQVREGVVFAVRRDDNTLRTKQTNRQPGELIPKSDTEFVWYNPDMIIDGQVTFVKDASGAVTHAAFRMNGNEIWRAKKIK